VCKGGDMQNCQCFAEKDKNLLISALAELKASYEKDIKRYYTEGFRKEGKGFKLFNHDLSMSVIDISNNIITHIDELVDEITKTPDCQNTPAMKGPYMTIEEAETWRAEQDRTERERMRKLGR
jgi:hypothetical protein